MLKSENLSLEQVREPREEQSGRRRVGKGKGEGIDSEEKPIRGKVNTESGWHCLWVLTSPPLTVLMSLAARHRRDPVTDSAGVSFTQSRPPAGSGRPAWPIFPAICSLCGTGFCLAYQATVPLRNIPLRKLPLR